MAGAGNQPGGRLWYVGLGSNVGDRERFLRDALALLDAAPGISVIATSRVYETEPWGDTDQAPFLNLAASIRSTLGPMELLAEVKRIEGELGRRERRRWGPREIDIDLLVCGDLRVDTLELIVPHPHLLERQFVLIPLAELDPDLPLPGGSVASELARGDGSVRLWGEAVRLPVRPKGREAVRRGPTDA